MDINWDEAPEGFDYALTTAPDWVGSLEYKGTVIFAKKRENPAYFELSDGSAPFVGPRCWVVIATRPEKWNGKGLPPVGTVCEHETDGFSDKWVTVEVLAHREFKGHGTGLLVVFATEDDVSFSSPECFRPLKTKEQLAAEEREKAVEEMFARFGGPGGLTLKQCIWVISEGYRKQENNDAEA